VASIPEGFELVDKDIPAGFEAVDASFPGAGFIEPALAVATAIPATIASGVTGLVAGAVGGSEAAAETQRQVQEAGTFEPKTAAGKEGLETLGDLVKFGVDVARIPLSGLGGIAELISSGLDVDQAVERIKSIQEQGVGKELGDITFEATESLPAPVRAAAATLAELIPDIALTATGLKGTQVAGKAAEQVGEVVTQAGKQIAPVVQAGKELISDVSKFQTPATREIARQLKEGEINSDVAQFRLADEGIADPTVRQKLLGADLPKVVKDAPAVKASRQGFEDGFLDTVRKKHFKN